MFTWQNGFGSRLYKRHFEKNQSKVKTIYNLKKDDDTINSFISKVFGKNNLFGYISTYLENNAGGKIDANFVHLDGKLEFINDYLTFLTNGFFWYGTYEVWNEEKDFDFFNFRNDNSKIFLKIEKGLVYFIVYNIASKVNG